MTTAAQVIHPSSLSCPQKRKQNAWTAHNCGSCFIRGCDFGVSIIQEMVPSSQIVRHAKESLLSVFRDLIPMIFNGCKIRGRVNSEIWGITNIHSTRDNNGRKQPHIPGKTLGAYTK
jgi:hypothetical protein